MDTGNNKLYFCLCCSRLTLGTGVLAAADVSSWTQGNKRLSVLFQAALGNRVLAYADVSSSTWTQGNNLTSVCVVPDCPGDLQYSNHSQCQPTCLQPHPDPACLLSPSPGCVCPAGTVMDGGLCVAPEQCQQCTYNNVTYQVGSDGRRVG